jgi:hypothetical protein
VQPANDAGGQNIVARCYNKEQQVASVRARQTGNWHCTAAGGLHKCVWRAGASMAQRVPSSKGLLQWYDSSTCTLECCVHTCSL